MDRILKYAERSGLENKRKNTEDAIRDALTDISDEREISIIVANRGDCFIQINIKDLTDVTMVMKYNESTKNSILETWNKIFDLVEDVKVAMNRCQIEYRQITFCPKSKTYDGDGDEVKIDLTLFISVLI